MRATKLLVKANDYNGHKNVLFMMKSDDFRVGTDNYTVLAKGKLSKNVLKTTKGDYTVFSDWSVKKL